MEPTIRAYDAMKGDTSLEPGYLEPRPAKDPLDWLTRAYMKLSVGNPAVTQTAADPRQMLAHLQKFSEMKSGAMRGPDSYTLEILRHGRNVPLMKWLEREFSNIGGSIPNIGHRVGAGSEMLAYKLEPSELVLKMRPGGLADYQLQALKDMPEGLLPVYQWGNRPDEMGYIVQPYAKPMAEQRFGHMFNKFGPQQGPVAHAKRYLEDLMLKQGYKFIDPQEGANIGMWQGKPYILDLGAILSVK